MMMPDPSTFKRTRAGIRTPSMTCITPLVALMSLCTIVAVLILSSPVAVISEQGRVFKVDFVN